MLVSIIVPIYNTENYLEECLDSILNQTYKKIEIILVDDGSTDKSFEIGEKYASRDDRVILLQSAHKGVVSARKLGVEKAKGDYCTFVDSDDWVEKDWIEQVLLLTNQGKADVVCYSMKSVSGNQIFKWKNTISEGWYEQEIEQVYEKMMFDFKQDNPGIIQSLCTKLIKRNILWPSIKEVDNRITMGEDAAVVYQVILSSKKILITNRCFYFYRVHSGSMCFSQGADIFSKIFIFQQYMQSIFRTHHKKYKLDQQLQAYLLSFIKKGLSEVFSLKIRCVYKIPFRDLEIGKKIVLYGAGTVGKDYYRQLLHMEWIEVIAWVDRGLEKEYIYNCLVQSPEVLQEIEFDNILIAVKEQRIAEEIKRNLCEYMLEDKILWKEPKWDVWEQEIVF